MAQTATSNRQASGRENAEVGVMVGVEVEVGVEAPLLLRGPSSGKHPALGQRRHPVNTQSVEMFSKLAKCKDVQ